MTIKTVLKVPVVALLVVVSLHVDAKNNKFKEECPETIYCLIVTVGSLVGWSIC